jgi:putative nucleotidyltransferase with HDIG domain
VDVTNGESPPTMERIRTAWKSTRLWIVLILGLAGCIVAISLPATGRDATFGLEIGDVTSQDILAPYSRSYISDIETERARLSAGESIPTIYDLPDSQTVRAQLEELNATLHFINAVRVDEFATREQKMDDLGNLEHIRLDEDIAEKLIELPDAEWKEIEVEAVTVLEQVMRSEIREARLGEVRRTIPALIGISLSEGQAELVAYLVSAFVAPNTMPNSELTEAARQQARDAVKPVTKTYSAGETIIRRGAVVTGLHLEALEQFGLLKPPEPWKSFVINTLLIGLLGAVFTLYAYQIHRELITNVSMAATISALFVINTIGIQFMIPERAVLPYLFPGAALSILLTVLFSPGMGMVTALVVGALAGFLAPRGLELALYVTLSSALAVLVIRKAERLGSFLWAGIIAAFGSILVIVIFRIPDPTTDLIGKGTLLGASLASGLLSASIAFVLLLGIGALLGITTNLQLIELSRPDHPLLQQLLNTAPGTYQHSLQVANLSEQAARAIGANPVLMRVGCLYHDVGKSLRPQFFIENQLPGQNVHEQLDPATSAHVIISHVPDGVELARQHRLPESIQAFIREHHGTLVTSFQYQKAVEAAGWNEDAVDMADFTYPGPRPRSKETALLMLADGVEARARAEAPQSREEIDTLIRWVIEDRLSKGQLARADLTLKDLDTIRETFGKTLRNIYHPRIKYPEPSAASSIPTQKSPPVDPVPTKRA